ncbi:MAG: META domain-containing protein [Bacteroidales bacterium]|nr:META domain-containing protein [Bacteroidales bacterium]
MKSTRTHPFIFLILLTALAGCRTPQETLVSVQTEFAADETWQLTAMRGREVTLAEGQGQLTLQINPEAGTFSGFSGCNRYFGTLQLGRDGHLTFSDFNGTKMACPEAFHRVESSYLQHLRKCDTYILEQYRLQLLQGDKPMLTFEKLIP